MADCMRLDKFLAREGLGTRSGIRKAVRAGKALVNGVVEKDPGRQISEADEVIFEGHPIRQEKYVYYMLHKPAGVLTASRDGKRRTVLDLLRAPEAAGTPEDPPAKAPGGYAGNLPAASPSSAPEDLPANVQEGAVPVLRQGLFPVGRLDRDTEGLLLITDDGQLAHNLLSPSKHVDKTYYAVVTGRVTEEDIRRFAQGMRIGGPEETEETEERKKGERREKGEKGEKAFTALPAKLCVAAPSRSPGRLPGTGKPGPAVFTDPSGPAVFADLPGGRPAESSNRMTAGLSCVETAYPPGGGPADLFAVIPADLRGLIPEEVTEYTQIFVTIREGKYHQIKRMFAAVGKKVLYLRRLTMGPLRLDPHLRPGEYRALTQKEKEELFLCVQGKTGGSSRISESPPEM